MNALGQPADETQRLVEAALRDVPDPCSIAAGLAISIVDMGIVRNVSVSDFEVHVNLRLTTPFCFQATLIRQKIEEDVAAVAGLPVRVTIDPTDDWTPDMMASPARAGLRRLRPLPATEASD